MTESWRASGDLTGGWVLLALGLVLAWVLLLVVELGRPARRRWLVFGSGLLAAAALLLAVLRPVRVESEPRGLAPSVLALVDGSRRLSLPVDRDRTETRAGRAARVVEALGERFEGARVSALAFTEAGLAPPGAGSAGGEVPLARALSSGALEGLSERPDALVLVSDGRDTSDTAALERVARSLGVPLHTVALTGAELPDASVRAVDTSRAVVAHQPFELRVEVLCTKLDCKALPVTVRDVATGRVLASGTVADAAPLGELVLTVTLDQPGARVLEVSVAPPAGDALSENDRRFITLQVTRDRVRILHLAGRPTYDVRALRRWLKSDASLDIVAFFILRDPTDPLHGARESDLALIPFPVDELFVSHLSSFDAVVLQDIDAAQHDFVKHLPRLAEYVRQGGGLVLVGGPSMFTAGGYAGTALEAVSPVGFPPTAAAFREQPFVPAVTELGQRAAPLAALRADYGLRLPELRGSNALGPVKPGAWVLWERPGAEPGAPGEPLLSLWETGQGRVIALGSNDTQRLAYGGFAAEAGGRGYTALWEGLVGWLMRDPRFEMLQLRLESPCVAAEPLRLRVEPTARAAGPVTVRVSELATGREVARVEGARPGESLTLGPVGPGGYTAVAESEGFPAARLDLACEHAGGAWRDARPDAALLESLAAWTGGKAVTHDTLDELPPLAANRLLAVRAVHPLAPAWAWSLVAALLLGVHWLLRRGSELA